MRFEEAKSIAERIKSQLEPLCSRCEIAGSIRRQKAEVGDIELVAIPKDRFQIGLIINKWQKVKGDVDGKYMQRVHPSGIKIDLFFATKSNWGVIYAIRTGNSRFSHLKLALGWVKKGYHSKGGILYNKDGEATEVKEEEDLFKLIGLDWVEPSKREYHD